MHSFHGLGDDSQADARSGASLGRVQALEDSKNPLVMFSGDANPVVLDPNPDRVFPSLRPDPNARNHARSRELQGILLRRTVLRNSGQAQPHGPENALTAVVRVRAIQFGSGWQVFKFLQMIRAQRFGDLVLFLKPFA